jgi:hypothetical protein
MTLTNTIGTVRVACCNAAKAGLLAAKMASGASAASSAEIPAILPGTLNSAPSKPWRRRLEWR